MIQTCYLLLGTNLGEKKNNLEEALRRISVDVGEIITVSGIYKTAAWGKRNQEDFYNQVLITRTSLTPIDILKQCLSIEKEMGRVRYEEWGERLIDIDILFIADQILDEASLKVPHPQIPHRRFTLVPLFEIAPDFLHPVYKKSIEELLEECSDPLEVDKLA